MAVIKIVPMPGAEGQQGETGAVGPQGPQGETGATGPAGADAVWYYNGEYNPGAAYVIGDVVTYDGQLWYRKNANGGNVGDTPSEGLFWDLLAAKGEDGVSGIVPLTGTWETNFFTNNGIVPDETYYEKSSLGSYTVIGDIVFWDIHLLMFNPTFTNPDQTTWVFTKPPFDMAPMINFPSNPSIGLTRGMSTGRLLARSDDLPYISYLDTDGDGIYDTVENGYGPDEFINIPIYTYIHPTLNVMYLFFQDPNDINNNSDSFKFLNASNPVDFLSETANSKYARIQISGWYKRDLPFGSTGSAVTGDTSFIVNGGTTDVQPTFSGDPLFSGSYVRSGDLVHFQIQVDMDNITSFGTGQYFVELPFNAKYGYQVREGCLHDVSTGKQYSIGGHVFAGEKQLLLSFTDSNGQDAEFDHNSPVTLSTADNFHISGSYIISE